MGVTAFESQLSGGHPNSLGNTVEVVAAVLRTEWLVDELIQTYSSADEVVRLRVSSALKRICKQQPGWIYARLARIEEWVDQIEQPSAQWTIAQMYSLLSDRLSPAQKKAAVARLQGFLSGSTDWIVLNFSMQTLAEWAMYEEEIREWLVPVLETLSSDSRKSVATRAAKLARGLHR